MLIRTTKKGYKLPEGSFVSFYFQGERQETFAKITKVISRRRFEISIIDLILLRSSAKYISCVERI